MTRVYVQLEAEGLERRSKSQVGDYAADAATLKPILDAVVAQLGPLTVLPLPAHEFNLKSLVGQDLLVAVGQAPSEASLDASAWVLVVKRRPSEAHAKANEPNAAEVQALSYFLEALP